MKMTRRGILAAPAGLASCGQQDIAREQGWPPAWDRILIERAAAAADLKFDAKENLLSTLLTPQYRYHTKFFEGYVHPTRESLDYALTLLELNAAPRTTRALKIVERILGLQNTDASSKWYGIWGWYLEEPPEKMQPADWNWADFNGSLLLLILLRHGSRLPNELAERMRGAVRHAAYSIRKRDVSPGYTNIAVMGTFVTAKAGELLGDTGLLDYARQRLAKVAEHIDRTGSFEEYNSPTYARVTLTSLIRMRMYWTEKDMKARAARIERRIWEHLAAHWDAPRMQFSGPMSRCYGNDLGYPLWLEKSLKGALQLAEPDNRSGGADAETAIHDFLCPSGIAARFLRPVLPQEHRELHQLPNASEAPVQGTTWLDRGFSLGSVNRGDFWVQRRPVLGYFGDASRPARSMQVRFVRDGYDFSSALFYSVQRRNYVLGLVNFRNPGGNRHVSLDPVKDGRFKCGRLFLEVDFEGLAPGFSHEVRDGIVRLRGSEVAAEFAVRGGRFGGASPRVKATALKESLVVTVDLLPEGPSREVRWAQAGEAWLAFTLTINGEGGSCRVETKSGKVHAAWETPAGRLELTGAASVGPVEKQNEAFAGLVDGSPVAVARLSDEKVL
jgi:hypothetical protein